MLQQHVQGSTRPVHHPAWAQAGLGKQGVARQQPVHAPQQGSAWEHEFKADEAALYTRPAASNAGPRVAEVAVPVQALGSTGDAVPGMAHADTSRKQGNKAAKKMARKAKLAQQREQQSKELEARLLAAKTRQQLMEYVQTQHPDPLHPSELVFVLNQLAGLCEARHMTYRSFLQVKDFVTDLLAKYPGHVGQLNAYELVVIFSALARVRYQPRPEWMEAYFAASQPHVPSYGPGYIYILLRSLVRMEAQVYQLKCLPSFTQWQETVLTVAQNKVWAYRGDELVRTLSAVSQLKWRAAPEWHATFSAAIKARLEYMEPPLLSQALLALSTLKHQPHPALLRALMLQLDDKLPFFDDRDLASTAQALLLVKRVMNADFFAEFMVEVTRKASEFSAASLASLLDAFATLVSRKLMLVSSPYAAPHTPTSPSPPAAPVAAAAAAAAATGSRPSSGDGFSGVQAPAELHSHRRSLFPQTSNSDVSVAAAAQPRQQQVTMEGGHSLVAPAHAGAAVSQSLSSGSNGLQAPVMLQAPQPRARSASPSAAAFLDIASLRPLPYDRMQLAAINAARTAPPPRRIVQDPVFLRSDNNPFPPKPPSDPVSEVGMGGWTVVLPAASPAWLRLIESCVQAQLPNMTVPEAAKALRGLGMLGHQVQPAVMEQFFAASKPKLHAAWPECYLYMVQAVALSGYQPTGPEGEQLFREWLDLFARIAARRPYTPDQVCDMVSALAALPVRPPDVLLYAILTHTRKNRPAALRHASPRRLALLIAALRRLQYRPDFGFLHSFAQAIRFHWSNAEPAELTAVMVALAALSPHPLAVDERWVGDMLVTIQCRMDRFDGPCLASILAGVVALGTDPQRAGPAGPGVPSPRFCELVFDRLLEQQRSLAPSHASSVLWAVACLHKTHQESSQLTIYRGDGSSGGAARRTWPPQRLIAAMLACVSGGVQRLTPAQIADAVWALQTLGHAVPAALQQAHQQPVWFATHMGSGAAPGDPMPISHDAAVQQQPVQQVVEVEEQVADDMPFHEVQQQQQRPVPRMIASPAQAPLSHALNLASLQHTSLHSKPAVLEAAHAAAYSHSG